MEFGNEAPSETAPPTCRRRLPKGTPTTWSGRRLTLQGEGELEAVVADAHAGGEFAEAVDVGFFVGLVGDVGFARADGLRGGDGPGDVEMRGVGLVAKAVDDENVDAFDGGADGLGDGGAVAHVGEELAALVREEKAERGDGTVRNREWSNGDASEIERFADDVRLNMDVTGDFVLRVECVGEGALDLVECRRGTVDGEGRALLHFAEAAEVVEAHEVIGVGMGKEDGVEMVETFAQRLLPEIGGRVDEDFCAGCADMKGGAGTLIARIGGKTNGATASDHGNPLGRAGTKDGDDQLRGGIS